MGKGKREKEGTIHQDVRNEEDSPVTNPTKASSNRLTNLRVSEFPSFTRDGKSNKIVLASSRAIQHTVMGRFRNSWSHRRF